MSNSIITATFRAISDEALNASGEVILLSTLGEDLNRYFDLLIQVEWLSGPKEGQTGSLLCSHYCRWPEKLLHKADFIEGCFTPQQYKQDKRLVLGYHPETITSYKWKKEGEVVEIITNLTEGSNPTSTSCTFQRGGNNVYTPTSRSFRRLMKVWGLYRQDAMDNDERPLSSEEAYCSFEQRFLNGELPVEVSSFTFSYLLNTIVKRWRESGWDPNLAISIQPNQTLSCTLPEYGEWCEVDGDKVTVVNQDITFCNVRLERLEGEGLGFMRGEPIRTYLRKTAGGLEVTKDDFVSGFWQAEPIKSDEGLSFVKESQKGLEVIANGQGYYKAQALQYSTLKSNELIVMRSIPQMGFWMAVDLPLPN